MKTTTIKLTLFLLVTLILTCVLLLLFTHTKPQNNFSGIWARQLSTANESGEILSENSYEIKLTQNGDTIGGNHCFSIHNAAKSDCGIENGVRNQTIHGKVRGNTAQITLQSSFSDQLTPATLERVDGKLLFQTTTPDDVVPDKLELLRQK